eukprot:scaffold330406_cov63-Tisochrysis_lutea.AAC.1
MLDVSIVNGMYVHRAVRSAQEFRLVQVTMLRHLRELHVRQGCSVDVYHTTDLKGEYTTFNGVWSVVAVHDL